MESSKTESIFSPFVLALLLLTLIFLASNIFKVKPDYLLVTFYDVGQGDSALITTPGGQHVLIDGGPNDDVIAKLDVDIPIYHRKLDAIFLSHPHADHLDGLISVVNKYEVKDVYLTGVLYSTSEYLDFLTLLKSKNIPTHQVANGSSLDFGNGITMSNFFPLTSLTGQSIENVNNSSIVSKLVYGDEKVLFTGDLEREAQEQLLATKPDLSAQVLKVPHHGSKDSANSDFINAILPKYAIISVGKDNKFGHPAQTHLDLLKGITVFRTDQDGDVRCKFSMTTVDCEGEK